MIIREFFMIVFELLIGMNEFDHRSLFFIAAIACFLAQRSAIPSLSVYSAIFNSHLLGHVTGEIVNEAPIKQTKD